MFATEFEYKKAGSVAEALQLLGTNSDSKILAGGHSLIPLMKLRLARPGLVIDIGGIAELKGIAVENGNLRIGPLTTWRWWTWTRITGTSRFDATWLATTAARRSIR